MNRLRQWLRRLVFEDELEEYAEELEKEVLARWDAMARAKRRHRHTQPEFWSGGLP